VILVGHSYGGVVITEVGNDPKVAGLVYVSAFAPDKGESAASLIKNAPQGAPVPPILPPQDGYLFLDKAKFPAAFAADVSPDVASFMADSQVPWLDGRRGQRQPRLVCVAAAGRRSSHRKGRNGCLGGRARKDRRGCIGRKIA
jgi:pimeloyl-ACP methyl ester carboxylesterase